MLTIPASTSFTVVFRAYLSADGSTVATGKTIAVTISKNGGSFGNPSAGATNATEISNGFYKFTLSTTDTNTAGPLAWRGTEADIFDAGDVLNVGVVPANVTQSLGVAIQNKDLTVASATSSTVTLPTAYANSSTLPNDASHAGKVLQVVAGTGEGQIVRLTTRVGSTREWNVAGMTTQLDNTSECVVVGTALADAAGVRTAVGLGSANLDTQLGVIATDASTAAGNAADARDAAEAVKITTDKLDDTLEDNAGTYRFTSAALAEGPGGGSAPTASEIADAVWDEAQSGHTSNGTFGKYLDAAVSGVSTGGVSAGDIADAVWDEALAGHTGSGSAGERMGRIPNAAANANGGLPVLSSSGTTLNYAVASVTGNVSGTIGGFTNAAMAQFLTLDTSLNATDIATGSVLFCLLGGMVVKPTGYDANDAVNQSVVYTITEDASGTLLGTVATINSTANAVKAKTDNLPASPAAVGSAMTLASGAISDATFTVPSEGTSPPTGTVGKIHWTAGRLGLRRVVRDILNGVIKVYQTNGTTVQSSNAYSADDSTEDISKAT